MVLMCMTIDKSVTRYTNNQEKKDSKLNHLKKIIFNNFSIITYWIIILKRFILFRQPLLLSEWNEQKWGRVHGTNNLPMSAKQTIYRELQGSTLPFCELLYKGINADDDLKKRKKLYSHKDSFFVQDYSLFSGV